MSAITTDLITRDSASDQTDRVFAEDPASVQTSQVTTEDSGSDQTDRVSAEDPASVQTNQVSTEDSASKQTDQVPTEDSASDQTDRVSAEDPVSVQASQVPTEDSASDPTDRVSAGDSAGHQVSSVFVTDSAHDWTVSNSADCSGSPPELDGDRTQDSYSGTPGRQSAEWRACRDGTLAARGKPIISGGDIQAPAECCQLPLTCSGASQGPSCARVDGVCSTGPATSERL